MALCTRSQDLSLAEQVKNTEAFLRGWIQCSKSVEANAHSERNRPQGRDKRTQTRESQLMDVMK